MLAGASALVAAGLATQACGQTSAGDSPQPPADNTNATSTTTVGDLVVTGTHISGGVVTSPITEITRKDIELGGFTDLAGVIDSLPANFQGGVNVQTLGVEVRNDNAAANAGDGSSANLRGLGSNATLVLLDGHRLALGGEGVSVDLSLLPLSIVDRVEVLTGSASAIYGSDAVGGVINIITRHDFDGFETRVRYGDAQDGAPDYRASQLAGFNWTGGGGGNLEIGYDYNGTGALSTQARSRSAEVSSPNYVYPGQTTNSLFLDANQAITPVWSVYAEGSFSDRRNDQTFNSAPVPDTNIINTAVDNTGGGLILGSRLALPRNWSIDVDGEYSGTETVDNIIDPQNLLFGESAHQRSIFVDTIWSAEARGAGDLFALPGGMARASVGASYRQEAYQSTHTGFPDASFPRDVAGVYGEADIPLVGGGNALPWLKSATLVAAGRYDHYSTFGGTFNPKVGLSATPFDGLVLRADYGTSFRAPQGFEESPSGGGALIINARDPQSASGVSESVYWLGGNPSLKPETAKSFTVSGEFSPPSMPGLRVTLDYYHIDYVNRIAMPDPNDTGLTNLAAPTIQAFITRNPTPAQVTAALAQSDVVENLTGAPFDPAQVGDIVDARYHNFARTRTSGIDFSVAYKFDSDFGEWTLTTSGTDILNLDDQFSDGGPLTSVLNTVYNPAGFKFRSGLVWSLRKWNAATYVNFVDSYDDTRDLDDIKTVGSWTTVDLHLGYRLEDGLAIKGPGYTTLAFDINNLFNQAPPSVAPNSIGYTYDPTNSSIVGRYVSVELVKKW